MDRDCPQEVARDTAKEERDTERVLVLMPTPVINVAGWSGWGHFEGETVHGH